MLRDQILVGGNYVLSCSQSSIYVGSGRLDSSHHFHDDLDVLILYDIFKTVCEQALVNSVPLFCLIPHKDLCH